MPGSSRTWAVENGGWSITDHLLATNSELTHLVYRGVIASIPTKHPRRVEPFRVTRPGPKPQPRRMSPAEFMQSLRG